MRDVAARAGVSAMTVSRALRGGDRVSAGTRQRVVAAAAAAALGYRRNDSARGLRGGRSSGLIGLVVPDLADALHAQLVFGVGGAASAAGLRVVLGATGGDVGRERDLVDDLVSRRVDGLVVVPAGDEHGHLDPASLHGTPVVLAMTPPSGLRVDCVLLDDFGGARAAVAHLVSAGHRRMAYLGWRSPTWVSMERLRGFHAALKDARVEVDSRLVRLVEPAPGAMDSQIGELVADACRPSALFAASKDCTLDVSRRLALMGVEMAVAGFDDVPLADLFAVPPVVVVYDSAVIGRRAAELLVDRIAESRGSSAPARRLVVPTTLRLVVAERGTD